MSAKKEKNVKEKKKISLTSMIFIALIAGAITEWFSITWCRIAV